MIKYTDKEVYNLIFEFVVEGSIKESDMIGALITLSTALHPEFNVNKLQTSQKIGKVKIVIDVPDKKTSSSVERTRGTIEIPSNMDSIENCIFIPILESITKVGLFSSKISLREVIYLEEMNYQKILKRGLEVYNRFFCSKEMVDLKKALLDLTITKKAITVGSFTLGSTFYESSHVILVEGRKDVLTLSDNGITNTFAVGGYHFEPQKVSDLLKGKTITLFLDGDKGGSQIEKKITQFLNVKYKIETPSKKSVEDLETSELFDLMKERKLVI